jgi:hypothetical protein
VDLWRLGQKKNNKLKNTKNNYIPFTSKLNFRGVVVRRLGVLVRLRVLLRLLRVLGVLFLNAELDFLLSLNRSGKGSRTSSIFPFDARSTIEIDFSLYSRLSSFRDSVTPVRRREDTEGDGNTGVKVQIDGLLASFLECLSNCR